MAPLPAPHAASAMGPAAWEAITTWANAVTVIRTAVVVPLGLTALVALSTPELIAAYVIYWAGDILDGWLARRLHQETRIGAVLDILGDRACCAVLVCVLAALKPVMLPALAVFIGQFAVVDCALSLAFLRWPLLSPNYFYLVDRTVWRFNWSPAAKTINTVAVVFAVARNQLLVALVVALGQLLLKLWSSHRVLNLTPTDGVLVARF